MNIRSELPPRKAGWLPSKIRGETPHRPDERRGWCWGKFWSILFLILLTLLLRAPGIPWGLTNWDTFESDEEQHVGVARNFINQFDHQYIPDKAVIYQWNARGFGTQLAIFSYPLLKLLNLPPAFLFGFARLLSLVYSIFLVLLIYFIVIFIYKDKKMAFLAAFLLSIFDLNITYSHYGTADIAHVFWAYLSIFSIFLFYQKQKFKWLAITIPLSVAMALSFKFDLVPLLVFLIGSALPQHQPRLSGTVRGFASDFRWKPPRRFGSGGSLLWQRKIEIEAPWAYAHGISQCASSELKSAEAEKDLCIPRSYGRGIPRRRIKEFLYTLLLFAALTAGFFYLSVGFDYNLNDFFITKKMLATHNLNAISQDNHLLHNPIQYFFAILSGTNSLITIAFILSLFHFFNKEKKKSLRQFNRFFLFSLGLSFTFLWLSDATFVRRANIFLPFIAITTSYGLVKFIQRPAKMKRAIKILIVWLIIIYTLGFSLVSQSHFLFDPRYQASEYLNKHFSSNFSIAYSPFAKVTSMPVGLPLKKLSKDVDLIVIHETDYGPYWKYFTTPFKTPQCCHQVCNRFSCDYQECLFIQNLFQEKTDYELIKRFPIKNPFPERVIFKSLFGTYETFLGDVLVFRKKLPSSR